MKRLPYDIEGIKGFLDAEEGERLYDLACEASKLGPCLEIGSYCGKSTVCLAAGCKKNDRTLFSIDHHRGSEEHQPGELYFDPSLFDPVSYRFDSFRAFRKTIEGACVTDTVISMVAPSGLCARDWATPLGLVFIDGGHSHKAAHTDYRAWSEHILPNGYLLIHDIFIDPDQGGQAPYEIYRLALDSGHFQARPMTGTLGVLQRR